MNTAIRYDVLTTACFIIRIQFIAITARAEETAVIIVTDVLTCVGMTRTFVYV